MVFGIDLLETSVPGRRTLSRPALPPPEAVATRTRRDRQRVQDAPPASALTRAGQARPECIQDDNADPGLFQP